MITDVIIKYYQSHKDTHLKFEKGFNVIVGNSHQGKSAITRALKLAVYNTPRGFGFRSHFAKPKDVTSVKVIKDTGDYVERIRNKTTNTYEHGNINVTKKNQPLAALNVKVPDVIQKILNINEINVSGQNDGYFLLNDSGPKIAKKLNDITGLSDIDILSANATKLVDEINANKKAKKENIKDLDHQIEKCSGIEVLAKRMEGLKEKSEKYELLKQEQNKLDVILEELENIQIKILNTKPLLKIKPKILMLTDLVKNYATKNSKLEKVGQCLDDLENNSDKITELKSHMGKIDLTSIKKKIEKYKDLDKNLNSLGGLFDAFDELDAETVNCQNSLIAALDERDALLKTQEICPLCKSKLGG